MQEKDQGNIVAEQTRQLPESKQIPAAPQQALPDAQPENPSKAGQTGSDALQAYRDFIIRRCAHLPLPIPRHGRAAEPRYPSLSLMHVYVELDTDAQVSSRAVRQALESGQAFSVSSSALSRPTDLRPLSALEAATLERRLLLLGDAGAGKTTFIQRLSLALASNKGLKCGQGKSQERLPLVIKLADFTCWLKAKPVSQQASATLLWDYMHHELEQNQLSELAEPLHSAVQSGTAQLLLDGLDEVKPELLTVVSKALLSFAQAYPQAWLLITCRAAYYEHMQPRLPAELFTVLRLRPFDHAKIQRFITVWYAALAKAEGESAAFYGEQAAHLSQALKQPKLAGLAGHPFLLTLISLVYARDKVLPDHRAALYERALDILLWRWGAAKPVSEPLDVAMLLREAGRSQADWLRVLRRFAFTSYNEHSAAVIRLSGIADAPLVQTLTALHPDRDHHWARALVDQISQCSGLLMEREPENFNFAQRPFQEYLAGVCLALHKHFASLAARLAGEKPPAQEVVLHAVGYKVHVQGELDASIELVATLCPPREPQRENEWRAAQLAGEVLLEIGLQRLIETQALGNKLLQRVRRQLTALLERDQLGPLERQRAGEVLGYLHDPRFDPERLYLPCQYNRKIDRSGGFVKIPAGSFWMGSSESKTGADPRGELVEIPYAYWMARYPVTVAQFGAFVADAGYTDERWWQHKAALQWLKQAKLTAPGNWEVQRQYPNRPVSAVSWFEACAYCAWLDARLRALDRDPLPLDSQVRLPSEAEWEKAARGAHSLPFPWGDKEWDEQRANVQESAIGHPTPVGMYPLGASVSGLHDLIGNVWEWTLSSWINQPDKPVAESGNEQRKALRGGSWSDPHTVANNGYRGVDLATARDAGIGFRVVVSLAQLE